MTQESNPYLPPTSAVLADTNSQTIVPASNGRRLGTMLVDFMCIGVLAGIGLGIAAVFGDAGSEALRQSSDDVFSGLVVLLMLPYYVLFEGVWGRTPGKLIFGTVVVNASGGKPWFGRILVRTLCRFIPFEPFSFLGKRGWHDSIPNTYVVLKRRGRRPATPGPHGSTNMFIRVMGSFGYFVGRLLRRARSGQR